MYVLCPYQDCRSLVISVKSLPNNEKKKLSYRVRSFLCIEHVMFYIVLGCVRDNRTAEQPFPVGCLDFFLSNSIDWDAELCAQFDASILGPFSSLFVTNS